MLKIVRIDKKADKEIKQFPTQVQAKFKALVTVLSRDGRLAEPFGKRLNSDLFEIRIKFQGQWRIIYAYLINEYIIILSAFHKKTQKTPHNELIKAEKRLKGYKYEQKH